MRRPGMARAPCSWRRRFGCRVVGVDLSAQNVARASAEADRLGLAGRVSFTVGDVERLPFDDASVDVVICECAFCTLPDKPRAAREFARVLTPGGHAGLSDITRAPGPDGELADLMAWIACLADARSTAAYSAMAHGGWPDRAGHRDPRRGAERNDSRYRSSALRDRNHGWTGKA